MEYGIVEFLVNYTVEVAPLNWLQKDDTTCLWPSVKAARLMKAIKQKEELHDDWKVEEYATRVLYRTGENTTKIIELNLV